MKSLTLTLLSLGLAACSAPTPNVQWTVTTPQTQFEQREYTPSADPSAVKPLHVKVLADSARQSIRGFGACFNELGWDALSVLDSATREGIIAEMFTPDLGASFTVCRMPVAANDFSRDWYSYNETDGDFEMCDFSIANDRETLIPFIHSALRHNPDLAIWASPWSPPSWMKRNGHYAMDTNSTSRYANGLTVGQRGIEGVDFFKLEPRYMQAYADYFGRFIDAYRAEGINICAVAPQNEFNSCQIFPSCTWTANGLNLFVGEYLGPRMDSMGVDLWFGTMERGNDMLVDTLLRDPLSSKYIKAVGFQWAGKDAVAAVHRKHPSVEIVQSESECGDGQNSWDFCFYTWSLIRHYMSHGATVYEYWNIALKDNGLSRWGWRQNSLVSVDVQSGEFRYNPEYYLMKHLSRYVKPGARYLPSQGEYADVMAFENPNGEIVVLAANPGMESQSVALECRAETLSLSLEPQSINTFVLGTAR